MFDTLTTLTISSEIFLLFALALALAFEFVNGFHDTAKLTLPVWVLLD